MKKIVGLAAVAAAVSSLAFAQDAAEEQTAEEPAGNETVAGPDVQQDSSEEQSDEGEEQSAEGLTGGQIIIEPEVQQFEDWSYICITDDAGVDSCRVQQILNNDEGGRVAIVEIFNAPEDSASTAGAAIALPLGLSLREGIELRIEGAPTVRYDYTICQSDGCLARIGLSDLAVRRMTEGADARITVRVGFEAEPPVVELDISSDGFREAYQLLADNPDAPDESAEAEVAQGEVIAEPEIEVFDDWVRSCLVDEEGSQQCRIRQTIVNESRIPLANIEIFKITGDERFQAGAELLLPHGVSLEDGLEIQIDDALPRRYQFSTCVLDGCLARIGFTDTELERMKAGTAMRLVFYTSLGSENELQFDFDASLIGFTRAFNSL